MGIIDSDYEAELMIVIMVPTIWTFKKGERLAQLLLLPSVMPDHSKVPKDWRIWQQQSLSNVYKPSGSIYIYPT